MAVYFIPRTKLISRATGINFKPKNWTKWTKRQISTSHHYYNSHENSKSSKGKLHKIRQWKKWAGATILPTISILDWWWLLAAGGWFSWQGIILRWTPIGIVIVAAASWHLHKRECIRNGLPQTAPAWQTMVYCSLPLRVMSRCFGWLAERPLPESLRPLIYGLYSSAFHVNIEEALVTDLKQYRSLSHFFTRLIKDDCRTISTACIVSPADGRVLHFGPVTSTTHLEQVKGITYSLESFFGPNRVQGNGSNTYIESMKKKREGTTLYHCVIYLAPGDYHRFHSPAVWKPITRRHFHGELLSVNPKIAKLVPGLFCINERVVYTGEWEHGFFSYTAVGATNVGSVQVYMDEELQTNRWRGFKGTTNKEYDELQMKKDITLKKGELVGHFNMGSTIVLVFEASESFRFNLKTNQVVKVGQSLGSFYDSMDRDSGMESED